MLEVTIEQRFSCWDMCSKSVYLKKLMLLFLCRLQKQPLLPSNYMCCAKSTCHIFKNYNAAGVFVLFFTSLFVLVSGVFLLPFWYCWSRCQSCSHVAREKQYHENPAGHRPLTLKQPARCTLMFAITIRLSCHSESTRIALHSWPKAQRLIMTPKVSITSQAKRSSNRLAFKHCQLLIRN